MNHCSILFCMKAPIFFSFSLKSAVIRQTGWPSVSFTVGSRSRCYPDMAAYFSGYTLRFQPSAFSLMNDFHAEPYRGDLPKVTMLAAPIGRLSE
jgi:hypothetical protein